MKTIHLAISCAGSGIGQSIVDSCKLSDLPLVTYGFDCNPKAYGIYDCDQQILTPKIDEPNYISEIIDICRNKKIDIFIPGTDHDVQLVAKHVKEFNDSGVEVIVSSPEFVDLVRDKERASTELNEIVPLFVRSYRKETIVNALEKREVDFPLIAKPLNGSGSVGVKILLDESDLDTLAADDVIQELAMPADDDINYDLFTNEISKRNNLQVSELSIHLVTDKTGRLLGRMMTHNKLKFGVPVEILPYDNPEVWQAIEPLVQDFLRRGWRGPLNIQGRLTNKGLRLFEMNARFTGISGLRAHFGFNEVDTCIRSWLQLEEKLPGLTYNPNLFGVRQTANKVVHLNRNMEVKRQVVELNSERNKKQTLLLTGSTGYLGLNLLKYLGDYYPDDFNIWILSRDVDRAREIHPEGVRIFGFSDLEHGRLPIGNVDILLHAAFARPYKSNKEIVRSLEFTSRLFSIATQHQVAHIINVSSQSVYGLITTPPWDENTMVSPESAYAHAKYSTELMLQELCRPHKQIRYTSLRLTGLSGGAKGLVNIDLVSRFVKQVKSGEDIKVVGGMQEFERLDIRDAVRAIVKLLRHENKNWKPVYNLGNHEIFSCKELADKVLEIAKTYQPNNGSKLLLETKDVNMKFGMDSTQFMEHTGWVPKYTLEETIHSLFQYDY